MKFKHGDIVRHKLTHERYIIIELFKRKWWWYKQNRYGVSCGTSYHGGIIFYECELEKLK